MRINLNQTAQVRLTEEGVKVFNAWDRETQFPGWVPKDLKAGDVYKDHLWHLMQVFGPRIYHGCSVPFEGNEIQLVGGIMSTIGCKASLSERFRYATVPPEDVHEALEELEAWRDMGANFNGIAYTPEECTTYVEGLEAIEEKPKDYDDLKSFFEDCISALNSKWPAAEPYDQNLRQVIMNAITRGDVEETEESQ